MHCETFLQPTASAYFVNGITVHMNGQQRLLLHERVKDHTDRLHFGGRTRRQGGPFISCLNNGSSRQPAVAPFVSDRSELFAGEISAYLE